MKPGGLRIGTPAMTSRGFTEADFERTAILLDRGVKIAKKVDEKTSGKKLKNFLNTLGDGEDIPELVELRSEVKDFASRFDLPWTQT